MVADNGKGHENAKGWTPGQPWPKGQSGNPAQAEKWKNGGAPNPPKRTGRPLSIASALKRKLREIVDPETKRRVVDEVADRLICVARKSKNDFAAVSAIDKIADRIDGKPMQRVESKSDVSVTIETPAHIAEAAAKLFGRSEPASVDD